MACPASTYSTVIVCSLLRPWLVGSVETGLGRGVTEHRDGAGQPPALVVARRRGEPVVAGAVEVERGRAARMVHQPDELPVTIARKEHAMGVQIIIEDLEINGAPMREHE